MDKDESTPPIDPSLTLSTTTTKPKRTKTTHACDLCKKKKVKCNGEHPCTRCQKLAATCTFTPNQSKWDSTAPYATTQAQRLYALEKALDALQVDPSAQSPGTTRYPTSSNNDFASVAKANRLGKFNTSSTGKPYYAEDWDTRLDRLPTTLHNVTTLSEKDAKIPKGLALSETTPIHFDLISIYFGHVHPYFPIVHQASFCHDLNSASPLLLNAMYAIASQWSDMGGLLPAGGDTASIRNQQSSTRNPAHSLKFYHDAIALVELYMDAPRLSTIRALLLLIKYQELIRRPGFFSRTRFYLRLAVRMCNDLGLSYVFPSTCQIQPSLAEERRRVFWAAYIYDLLISTELGTPVQFSIDQCTVEFPGLLDDEKTCKEQHNAILYLHWIARVMKAQGMVLHYLRQKYEGQQHQHQQNLARRLHSIDQHMKGLGLELSAWKEHGSDRFDFIFLAYHFTNILLYRSLSLDLVDKTAVDGITNKPEIGVIAGHDTFRTLLLQEADLITNTVYTLVRGRPGIVGLHHGFRGAQQLIHYLTGVRTVQLMYLQGDGSQVMELIHDLTTLTPAVELYAIDQRQLSRLGAEIGSTENRREYNNKYTNEKSTNQQRLPAPSPLSNTPQTNSIYADDDYTGSLNNTLLKNASSCSDYYQYQHWTQQYQHQQQQNGSKHNANLTLDTSALPLLYQPSSSSDISPMIPTPLSLNAADSTTIVPTTPSSSATQLSIRARRSHQHLRKTPTPQWLSPSTGVAVSPDLLSPTYSRSNTQNPSSSPAPPSQRMHAMTSRQSSPSTSSLPSSPLHRMTLSDDPAPWGQSTPSLVLFSYPEQQQQQQQQQQQHPPVSPSYVQSNAYPTSPSADQHHMIYNTTLENNVMVSSLPPAVDEAMNELLAPASLAWNHL